MRSRRRFWMILDRKDRQILVPQSSYCFVVEVYVGNFDVSGEAVSIDRKAVIVGRYFDLASG